MIIGLQWVTVGRNGLGNTYTWFLTLTQFVCESSAWGTWPFMWGTGLDLILCGGHQFLHTPRSDQTQFPPGLLHYLISLFSCKIQSTGLKPYAGSVQVQVTLKIRLWNSPGPGCLVLCDVMQALNSNKTTLYLLLVANSRCGKRNYIHMADEYNLNVHHMQSSGLMCQYITFIYLVWLQREITIPFTHGL